MLYTGFETDFRYFRPLHAGVAISKSHLQRLLTDQQGSFVASAQDVLRAADLGFFR